MAQLYGTKATMEHHHFNHAVMILNSEVVICLVVWVCVVFFVNQVFNEIRVIVMLKPAEGGRAVVNFWFPLNNLVCFGLLTLSFATQVSVIKVKVTFTKNRNSVSAE